MSTPTAEERAHGIADMAAAGGYRPDAHEFKASVLAETRAAVEAALKGVCDDCRERLTEGR